MIDHTLTKRFGCLLVPLFLSVLTFSMAGKAEESLPPQYAAQEGNYKSYAIDILQMGVLKDANEARLIQKLQEPWPSAAPNLPLLACLGYLAKIKWQPMGLMTPPGKKPEPVYTDDGVMTVQMQRMTLQGYFEDVFNYQHKRIYVFARFRGWPGINSTCVMLTTDKDDVLDWCFHEQVDVLENAIYDPTSHRLSLTCRHRQGGKITYLYDIGAFGVSRKLE